MATTMTQLSIDPLPEVSKDRFRAGMARFAGAVNVITTDGRAGRAGFTATAVCSVCDTPPTLLVCVNNTSSVGQSFRDNGHLCVNTLGPRHESLAMLFGGKTPSEERFAAAEWETGVTGAPMLKDALVSFDCDVAESKVVGTHSILLCTIRHIAMSDDDKASIYAARQFHQIEINACQ